VVTLKKELHHLIAPAGRYFMPLHRPQDLSLPRIRLDQGQWIRSILIQL
jgi:hypothetical protein